MEQTRAQKEADIRRKYTYEDLVDILLDFYEDLGVISE